MRKIATILVLVLLAASAVVVASPDLKEAVTSKLGFTSEANAASESDGDSEQSLASLGEAHGDHEGGDHGSAHGNGGA